MVANWREKTESSLSLTFFFVSSMLSPRPCLPTSSGVRPCSRSRCRTKASLSATSVPLMRFPPRTRDRKSTRLNSSHMSISYAVFCLKKKKKKKNDKNLNKKKKKKKKKKKI